MGKKSETTIKVVKNATKVASIVVAVGTAVLTAISGDKK